mmetsp:Transcript_86879/g.241806  ORF Transcript_86879/g.241806 Transcript_86879/m.241806 type:complete len:240 (+) Transcript_86879:149-868(+)
MPRGPRNLHVRSSMLAFIWLLAVHHARASSAVDDAEGVVRCGPLAATEPQRPPAGGWPKLPTTCPECNNGGTRGRRHQRDVSRRVTLRRRSNRPCGAFLLHAMLPARATCLPALLHAAGATDPRALALLLALRTGVVPDVRRGGRATTLGSIATIPYRMYGGLVRLPVARGASLGHGRNDAGDVARITTGAGGIAPAPADGVAREHCQGQPVAEPHREERRRSALRPAHAHSSCDAIWA